MIECGFYNLDCFNDVGVGIVIPDEKDLFNAIWFDFVEDDKEGELPSA